MKRTTSVLLTVFLVGLLAVGAVSAFGWGKGPNEAATQAMEQGDYQGWRTAMINDLTEDRFNELRDRQGQMEERRAQMQQHREDMEAALESGDFDTWKSLMEDSPRQEPFDLTEENFEIFVQMHEAHETGDYETAQELREELGLGGPGMGRGVHGMGGGPGMGGFGGECQNAE